MGDKDHYICASCCMSKLGVEFDGDPENNPKPVCRKCEREGKEPETMEERQCGMCKKTKTIGAFRAKPNGTHTKTCISCLEKVKEKDTKRRAKDKTPPPAAPNQKNKTSKGVPPAEAECRPGDRQLTDGDLRLATVTSAREHDLLTIALTRNPARDRLEAVAREACVHRLLGILMSIHDELLRQIERGEFEHAE